MAAYAACAAAASLREVQVAVVPAAPAPLRGRRSADRGAAGQSPSSKRRERVLRRLELASPAGRPPSPPSRASSGGGRRPSARRRSQACPRTPARGPPVADAGRWAAGRTTIAGPPARAGSRARSSGSGADEAVLDRLRQPAAMSRPSGRRRAGGNGSARDERARVVQPSPRGSSPRRPPRGHSRARTSAAPRRRGAAGRAGTRPSGAPDGRRPGRRASR